jgi:hypothetical protein
MDNDKVKTDGYITIKVHNDLLVDNIMDNYNIGDELEISIQQMDIRLKVYEFVLKHPSLSYMKKSLTIKGEIIKEQEYDK